MAREGYIVTAPRSDADNPILRPHEDYPLLLRYQTTDGEVIGKATLHPDGSVTADPWTGPPTTILAVSVWTPTFRELEAYERAQRREGGGVSVAREVYIVTRGSYSDYEIRAVFQDVERAKAFVGAERDRDVAAGFRDWSWQCTDGTLWNGAWTFKPIPDNPWHIAEWTMTNVGYMDAYMIEVWPVEDAE